MHQKSKNKSRNEKAGIESIFQEINRSYIRLNSKEKKENTQILFSVLNKLINLMRKTDHLFDSLRPRLDFLGSYFDRLRVGQATEYDINVVLTFPVNYGSIKLDATNCEHDYTNIIMPSEFRRLTKIQKNIEQGFSKTLMWCNKEYKLSVIKFRSWMQSTVQIALNSLPLEDGMRILIVDKNKYKVNTKLSGPANTITIIKSDKSCIDVDLVPTLTFMLPTRPINSKVLFAKVTSTKIDRYFVVPKPNGDEFSWRLTFPFQERHYLKYKNNLKSTIRLIKHFRDVQDFGKLSSYYIKTLFLWECSSNDESYWSKNSLSYLVLNMLKKLRDCLGNYKIINFWCPSHNVLERIKPVTCQNWYNRLCFVLNEIENNKNKNPRVIKQYFSK